MYHDQVGFINTCAKLVQYLKINVIYHISKIRKTFD